jgi:hypothetical protein
MPQASELLNALLWLTIAGSVLAFLHILATAVGNERHLHDLRVRVNTLRNMQFERLRRQQDERGGGGFDVVDEASSVNSSNKKAA